MNFDQEIRRVAADRGFRAHLFTPIVNGQPCAPYGWLFSRGSVPEAEQDLMDYEEALTWLLKFPAITRP